MKKLFVCGLVVLLIVCIAPVAALTAVDDLYYINKWYVNFVDDSDIYSDILENDFPITPSVAIEITQAPIYGFAFINSEGILVYQPDQYDYFNYEGHDYVKYRLFDGYEYSNEATVDYNLKFASAAGDDSYRNVANCPYLGELTGNVLSNDGFYDPLKIKIETTEQPTYGSLYWGLKGKFIYNGDPSYFGPVSFKYRLYDGQWYSNNATVNLDVVPWFETNSQVSFSTPLNTKLVVDNNDYLLGMHYSELEFFEIIANPSHGTLTPHFCGGYAKNGYGCFDYMPDASFKGKDTFVVQPWFDTATCGWVPSRETTVTIFVGDSPYPTPEFPSALLPMVMIIGFLATVLLIQKTREH